MGSAPARQLQPERLRRLPRLSTDVLLSLPLLLHCSTHFSRYAWLFIRATRWIVPIFWIISFSYLPLFTRHGICSIRKLVCTRTVVVEGCPSICRTFLPMALSHRVGDVLSNGRRVSGRLSMNFLGSHVVLLLGFFGAYSAYDLCPCPDTYSYSKSTHSSLRMLLEHGLGHKVVF
jgi:hypothetical protein